MVLHGINHDILLDTPASKKGSRSKGTITGGIARTVLIITYILLDPPVKRAKTDPTLPEPDDSDPDDPMPADELTSKSLRLVNCSGTWYPRGGKKLVYMYNALQIFETKRRDEVNLYGGQSAT